MGLYLRKSIKLGPLRFNLSGSGVGVSGGIKGFRVGSGPRGNYVHIGRHGLYYRAALPSPASRSTAAAPAPIVPRTPPAEGTASEMHEIESGSVEAMVNSSSAELLEEIRTRRKRIRLSPIAITIGTILCFAGVRYVEPAWIPIAVLGGLTAASSLWLQRRDELRKTVVLMYDLDADAARSWEAFQNGFRWLATAQRVWHLRAKGATSDWKRSAGANVLIQRSAIRPAASDPPGIKTNIAIPAIPVGNQVIYFFPDRLLVFDRGKVGSLGYDELRLTAATSRFVEEEAVPSDAPVVGSTWRFVNKSGGPDRRFNNNRQMPILNYGELYLESVSGLNEALQVSNPEAPKNFASGLQVHVEQLKLAKRAAPEPTKAGGVNPVP
jgi:hypothetical protein